MRKVTFFILFIFTACASSTTTQTLIKNKQTAQPQAQLKKLNDCIPKIKPEWVYSTPKSDGTYDYFVGVSKRMEEEQDARGDAMRDAVNQFVDFCGVDIKNVSVHIRTIEGKTSLVLSSKVRGREVETHEAEMRISRIKASKWYLCELGGNTSKSRIIEGYKAHTLLTVPVDEADRVRQYIKEATLSKENKKRLAEAKREKEDAEKKEQDMVIEKIRDGEMDWGKKVIRVKGFGAANKTFPKHVWQKSAEEAAMVDAQAKLVEVVDGFKLESKTFMKNYQVESDEKIKIIKGSLSNVRKVGKTIYPTPDTAEVTLELTLEDVL